jgi:CHAT domain-containing protein/tetratricopeptide (TPR) repeat protein
VRIRGDRQENIDVAIALYEAALAAVPRLANPTEWAMTQVGLGNAYAERAADRPQSVERAIAAHEAAAAAAEPASAPQVWVATRVGLGNAHLDRLGGGRAENVEQSIRHFTDGLAVATRADMPREWAVLQHGLGGAYALRRLGERATNLQRALAACEAALEVRTRAAGPLAWAMTLQNLGSVLMDPELPGDRSAYQERALETQEAALEIVSREAMPQRWGELRSNVGAVYGKRLIGDRLANLRAAVAAFTDVLELRTKGTVAWAQAQRNLGTAYGDLALLDGDQASADLVDRAFAAFAAALPVLRAENRVQETRDAAKCWGDLAYRLERWREAADTYEISMDAADDLYGASVLAAGKRSELDESIVVCQRAALAWGQAGTPDDLVRAVVAVERSRARWLGETLAQDQADLAEAEAVDADTVARYRKAAATLRELEGDERRLARVTAQGSERDDATVARATEDVLTAQLREGHTELAEAIEGVRVLGGSSATFLERPGFDTVVAALNPGQALAYLLVTAQGSLALLAHRPLAGPPAVSSVRAELTTRELASILVLEDGSGGYLSGQAYAPHSLGGVLATALPMLGERLVAPIARRLRELSADEVTLVPCGLLGTLPLPAAEYTHDGALLRLIDELDVSYSPSARVLATARARLAASPAGSGPLAGVGNPTSPSPLRYAERELHAVGALFSDARPLFAADATAEALTRVATDAEYVHLACHGEFDVLAPLESGLELADRRLSVREILETRPFAAARLVVASACKSMVFDVIDLPDEVVGLPAGILCGGTPGVVGTLWSVDDRSTAILMFRFYAYHMQGDPPARALRRAQRWLSTATLDDLATALPRCGEPHVGTRDLMPGDGTGPGREQGAQPYSDPFYWAPFVSLGV